MLEIHVSYPKHVDFNSLKKLSEKDIYKELGGKVMSTTSLPPPILLRRKVESLHDIKPSVVIKQFTKILGVDDTLAARFYTIGARTIEELVKDPRKYSLNVTQLNGCLYYEDLLYPVSVAEEAMWVGMYTHIIDDVRDTILSTVVQSRPNGYHARIEVLICVITDNILSVMQQVIDSLTPYIPDMKASIMEVSNTPIGDRNMMTRVKCITQTPGSKKHNIQDITIYSPVFHPYPLLRTDKGEASAAGYDLKDDGVWKDGKPVSFRKRYGRDNAMSLEEIIADTPTILEESEALTVV